MVARRRIIPQALFIEGEEGAYSDILAYATDYFTDAGTTPAAPGQPVQQITNQAGGAPWTQGTLTARPVLAREPLGGRRNFINRNTDMHLSGGSYWTLFGFAQEDLDSRELQEDDWAYYEFNSPSSSNVRFLCKNFQAVLGQAYSLSCEVEVLQGSADMQVSLQRNASSQGPSGPRTVFSQGGKGVLKGESLIEQSDTSRGIKIMIYDQNSVFPLRFRVRLAQAEVGAISTHLQRVNTQYDITEDGVSDAYSLWFDLADDAISTMLPAGTYTIALPTHEGLYYDTVEHAGGTFTVGPTSYTGGPAGILSALASDGVCRMAGPPLLVDRALTASEQAALTQWFTNRGAGPELELGPELVVNGGFDTDLIGWTAAGPYTEWDDGAAKVGGAVDNGLLYQAIEGPGPFIFAAVTTEHVALTGTASLQLKTNSADSFDNALPFLNTPGRIEFIAATATHVSIRVAGGDSYAKVDNVSVRRIQPKGT